MQSIHQGSLCMVCMVHGNSKLKMEDDRTDTIATDTMVPDTVSVSYIVT